MSEMINGRTLEEIKRILRLESFDCSGIDCFDCEYIDICKHVYIEDCAIDGLAYIEHLEAERDAAIKDIPRACGYCKHYNDPPKIEETELGTKVSYCEKECHNISGVNTGWEWRGLPEPLEVSE